MKTRHPFWLFAFILFNLNISVHASKNQNIGIGEQFATLFFLSEDEKQSRIEHISANWEASFTPMAIEVMSLARADLAQRLIALLQQKTGQSIGYDTNDWFVWWWKQVPVQSVEYADFKASLYRQIDPKFDAYFSKDRESRVRMDEIRWGGVRQDGIPPLRQPKMINASEASYLDDDNVVFGIEINGDARAYPKRILAWHEMFVDTIGGTDFVGVYCTLCGAVILYKTNHNGVQHHLGTSGFLYRSNKVMYDKNTQSLWNTTWGEPVVGPLVGKNIRLKRSYLVTTTWEEWKRRHPNTTVLSIDTKHQRDYSEGVAYKQYFATDELMFSTSTPDHRLKNKDEILALTFPNISQQSMAISAEFLAKKPVYKNSFDNFKFVIFTDASGANRVYESKNIEFISYDQDITATDSSGKEWTLAEDKLVIT
ncbi:MAG: hypothetical protein ACI9JR_000395, partial [Gammaproteobacteria bacterium]